MKKISLTILLLLTAVNCFAEPVYLADRFGNVITPQSAGRVFEASAPTFTGGAALSFGTSTTGSKKVVISVPLGTAYVGGTDLTGYNNGIAIAATQTALVLDIDDISTLRWIGPRLQRLNYVIIK